MLMWHNVNNYYFGKWQIYFLSYQTFCIFISPFESILTLDKKALQGYWATFYCVLGKISRVFQNLKDLCNLFALRFVLLNQTPHIFIWAQVRKKRFCDVEVCYGSWAFYSPSSSSFLKLERSSTSHSLVISVSVAGHVQTVNVRYIVAVCSTLVFSLLESV